MEINISLNVEAIVAEEIRNYVRENLIINNISQGQNSKSIHPLVGTSVTTNVITKNNHPTVDTLKVIDNIVEVSSPEAVEKVNIIMNEVTEATNTDYEYAPKNGRRRTKLEILFHEKELFLNRRLTPEEKASLEFGEEKEIASVEAAKNKLKAEETLAKITELAKTTPEVTVSSPSLFEKPKEENIPWDPPESSNNSTATIIFRTKEETIPEAAPLDNLNSLFPN